jgi:hypothetical protein
MEHLIQTYGIALGLCIGVLGFLAGQWPVLRDKGIPALWNARRQRERQWIEVIDRNTRAMEALAALVGGIDDKQDQVLTKVDATQQDVAAICDRAQIRPARRSTPATLTTVGA